MHRSLEDRRAVLDACCGSKMSLVVRQFAGGSGLRSVYPTLAVHIAGGTACGWISLDGLACVSGRPTPCAAASTTRSISRSLLRVAITSHCHAGNGSARAWSISTGSCRRLHTPLEFWPGISTFSAGGRFRHLTLVSIRIPVPGQIYLHTVVIRRRPGAMLEDWVFRRQPAALPPMEMLGSGSSASTISTKTIGTGESTSPTSGTLASIEADALVRLCNAPLRVIFWQRWPVIPSVAALSEPPQFTTLHSHPS